MGSCIIEKFGYYVDLSEDEKKLLAKLEDKKITYKAGERIRSKGDGFDDIYIIYDGWAYVSSDLDKGLRSIFDIRLPADFVGVAELSFQERLYDFIALTDVTVCPFPKDHLDDMFNKSQKLRDIFLIIMSREQAISYERIISVGRRTAIERISHFIAEVSLRHSFISGKMKEKFSFPLRQDHIADILGLSSVHVSRAMTNLKDNGYIKYNRREMTIADRDKLFNLSGFSSQFLLKPFIDQIYQDR